MKSPEQKSVFQSLLNRIGGKSQASQTENELIDLCVNTVEPQLKMARGYRKRLLEPLLICREHCRKMVEKIPGPIYLKHSRYHEHPVIKASFAGSGRIEDLLDRADGTNPGAPLSGNERVALLTMMSTERTVYGRKMLGDMIVGDAAMRTITFTDHNIVGLATTLADSKNALEQYCLEIIVQAAARKLSEIRTKLVDLRQRQERLSAMKKMFGDTKVAGMGSVFVPYDPEKEQKQRELEQLLVENQNEIAAARSVGETPKDWLIIVEKFLSKPEDILNMQLISLRLDWSNSFTDDPAEEANTITLATFTLADEMQRECVLVAYDRERPK